MATVEMIGGTTSTPIPKDAYLRIGFSERWALQFDSGFAARFRAVHANLPTQASVFPANPPNVAPGANAAVIDARNGRATTFGELAAKLDDVGGNFVRVVRIEVLSDRQRRELNSPAAVAARDKAAEEIAKDAKDDSLLAKFMSLNNTVRLVSAAVLAILFVTYVLPHMKGLRSWK